MATSWATACASRREFTTWSRWDLRDVEEVDRHVVEAERRLPHARALLPVVLGHQPRGAGRQRRHAGEHVLRRRGREVRPELVVDRQVGREDEEVPHAARVVEPGDEGTVVSSSGSPEDLASRRPVGSDGRSTSCSDAPAWREAQERRERGARSPSDLTEACNGDYRTARSGGRRRRRRDVDALAEPQPVEERGEQLAQTMGAPRPAAGGAPCCGRASGRRPARRECTARNELARRVVVAQPKRPPWAAAEAPGGTSVGRGCGRCVVAG